MATRLPGAMPRWLATAILLGLLALVLLATWLAYHPGLTGGFLFDDFANLPAIGATGPVDNWGTFWRYITSGHADPTGRPITLLTFLIDARTWPADPRPFLVTSVILHLINGVLLFWLVRQLGRALVYPLVGAGHARDVPRGELDSGVDRSRAWPAPTRVLAWPAPARGLAWRVDLAALLGAGLWLLHPLLVSTTLYIVQREAMLPATFVLVGLMLWLLGRRRMLAGHTTAGIVWMLVGLGGCTLLATLSKANGVLLPALALTIEYTVLRHGPVGAGHAREALADHAGSMWERSRAWPAPTTTRAAGHYRWALGVLGWLPAGIVAAYLVDRGWNGIVHGISSARPWTLGERLITEPRVLLDYLQLLWIPRPFTPGLFNDQIHASVSLLQPWTTLPCLLAVVALIVAALLLRKRWPAWALAVLFYFVGQALESSSVALELYFEHRNYLPAMLMFWALALWLCGVPQRSRAPVGAGHARDPSPDQDRSTRIRSRAWPAPTAVGKGLLAIALLVGLGVMTHARAGVWGNTREQALLWAKLNPESPRAQANAALAQMHAGRPRLAADHLRVLLKRDPTQLQLALNLFAAECSMGHVTPAAMQAAKTALATTRNPGALLEHWFSRAINETTQPPCPQLTLGTIEALLAAAHSNPKLMAIGGRRQDLLVMRGHIALKRQQPDQALSDFKRGLDQNVRTSAALAMVAELGSHGYPRRGLALLDYFETQARPHMATPGFGMPRVHAWVLRREDYWPHEIRRLRKTLQQDAAAKADAQANPVPGAPARDTQAQTSGRHRVS